VVEWVQYGVACLWLWCMTAPYGRFVFYYCALCTHPVCPFIASLRVYCCSIADRWTSCMCSSEWSAIVSVFSYTVAGHTRLTLLAVPYTVRTACWLKAVENVARCLMWMACPWCCRYSMGCGLHGWIKHVKFPHCFVGVTHVHSTLLVAARTGSGALMRRDSCVDFGAV